MGDLNNNLIMKTVKKTEPYVGQKIYVPTAIYLSHGLDDFIGGIATISKIEKSKDLTEDHYNFLMVVIEENPGTRYNWKYLLEEQKELKERFGRKHAHPEPDDRPEFNMWE